MFFFTMYLSSGCPSNHVSGQRMHTNLSINKRKLKIPFFWCMLTCQSRDSNSKVDSYGSFSVQVYHNLPSLGCRHRPVLDPLCLVSGPGAGLALLAGPFRECSSLCWEHPAFLPFRPQLNGTLASRTQWQATQLKLISQPARAAITKHHRLWDLNNRNLFSHSSGEWKSQIKVSAKLVSLEASSLACRWLPSHCVFTRLFIICTHPWCLIPIEQ